MPACSKKDPFKANLVMLTDMNFIASLKIKPNWGSDQRNKSPYLPIFSLINASTSLLSPTTSGNGNV